MRRAILLPILLRAVLAASALLGASGCNEAEVEETLRFEFQDDLSRYDKVQVLLLHPADSNQVLEVVFEGRLEPGQSLPDYPLKASDRKDFIVRVTGYDDDGLVAYRNDITRTGDRMVARVHPDTSLPGGPPVLSDVKVSAGSLSPGFDRDSLAYQVKVAYEDSVFVLTPTFPGRVAGVTVQGESAAAGEPTEPIDLRLGKTVIEAKVISQSGKVRVYVFVIERSRGPLSPLSRLSLLSVSLGSLTPPFHKDTLDYRVFAAEGSTWASISALAEDDSASVIIPPQPASKGSSQGNLPLRVGTNLVTVKVVAEDTTQSRSYNLAITVPPNSLGKRADQGLELP